MWTKTISRQIPRPYRRRTGLALLSALALLMIFVGMGAFYIRYMEIESEATDFALRTVRARHVASAGVSAALAEVQKAIAAGNVPAAEYPINLPVYGLQKTNALGFGQLDSRHATAQVTVVDEGGKININHATVPVLRALFGIDEAAAAKIIAALPAAGAPQPESNAAGHSWLISLDDMVARGLLTQAAADAVASNLITFSSVVDHALPEQYVNVNGASVWTLTAMLGVAPEVAQAIAAARPFHNIADLAAAAGKDPAAFNLPAAAIGFTSRCYRVTSEGSYANVGPAGEDYRVSTHRVSAVVVFNAVGVPKIALWTEGLGKKDVSENSGVAESAA